MAQESFPWASPPTAQNPEGVVNTDAKYRRMSRWWREDGVVDGYGEALVCSWSAFSCRVGTGAAFVNGVFYENTTPLTLTHAGIAAGQSRVDRIVLRLDVATKTVVAAIKAGTVGSIVPPPLTRTAAVWEATLDQVLVNSSGGFDALGNRYDRWSYGDRRVGRPPAWNLRIADGALLPRATSVRLPLVATSGDLGTFGEGCRVTFGAATSGVTIERDGVYDVFIQGRVESTDSTDKAGAETVYVEQQRIIGGVWTRVARIGGPDGTVSNSGFVNTLRGDVIVPFAYQNNVNGTWRVRDRADEAIFAGVWRRDYGGS